MTSQSFRQVHLDFHTSPHIGDVGADWDPDLFARTMVDAHVQSVTLFATCHHGLAYYPSTTVPVHPALQFDLLADQMRALRAVGIATPVYVTVGGTCRPPNAIPSGCRCASTAPSFARPPPRRRGATGRRCA